MSRLVSCRGVGPIKANTIRSIVTGLKANDGLATSESFTLGVAVGLGLDLGRLGRAYALSDAEAEKVRSCVKAHYRKHPGKSLKEARASA